jgi:hypothetical protein
MELSLAHLKAWLADQDPEIVVGYTCNTHDCPMARYLRAVDPEHHWCVCLGLFEERPIHAVYYDDEGDPIDRFELPEWARQIVTTVDGRYITQKATAITAHDLLGIAERLREEPGGPRWR